MARKEINDEDILNVLASLKRSSFHESSKVAPSYDENANKSDSVCFCIACAVRIEICAQAVFEEWPGNDDMTSPSTPLTPKWLQMCLILLYIVGALFVHVEIFF